MLVDQSLTPFERVWAAAGHSHACVAIAPCDLLAALGVEPVDVAERSPGSASAPV